MSQRETGILAVQRTIEKLRSLGLEASESKTGLTVFIEVFSPKNPARIAKIKAIGRNPESNPDLRWFQVRISPGNLETARSENRSPEQAWMEKVDQVDFFVLDSIKLDEAWVLDKAQAYALIVLNSQKYATRPDNVFNYAEPLKQKQKEMNLDIAPHGLPLTEVFSECKNNFEPILRFLEEK